jgi:antirestriction protein ArdC
MMASAYEVITDQIIAQLKKGTVPWDKPFSVHGAPRNAVSGKAYRGINSFLLTMQHHADPRFVTFRQAQQLGGSVTKGEHGFQICFYKLLKNTKKADDSRDSFPMFRYYTVFNVSQCGNLKIDTLETEPRTVNPIDSAESILTSYPNPPTIDWTSSSAFYRPSTDHVSLPPRSSFQNDELAYSVAFHELVHSTGHASRLNRESLTDTKGYGSAIYGREELIAELGSSFLLGAAGVRPEFSRSASYIASWLKVLTEDPRAIIKAASAAQKASDYILNIKTGG